MLIEDDIVTAIRARLTMELAAPAIRYVPLWAESHIVGWLDDSRADLLRRFAGAFAIEADCVRIRAELADPSARTAAIDRVARALSAQSLLSTWRDERYAIAPESGGPALFHIERAAARYFGVATRAAHVNGVVGGDGDISMWFARRSPTKSIDPGMLDNLVGGGVAGEASIGETVIKESFEEAGIPPALARLAQPSGEVRICRARPDGLQRETIHVHDLWLPADFRPRNQDGESVDHRLVDIRGAASLIAITGGPDVVTADASLVVLDFLLRHGAIARDSPHYEALAELRAPAMSPRSR